MISEELKLILTVEFEKARQELEKLRGEITKVKQASVDWEQVGKNMKRLGRDMSIAFTVPIALAGRAIVKYAKEQEQYEETFAKLSEALKVFAEVVAKIIVPWIDKTVDVLRKIVDWFSNLDEGTQKTIISILGIVAALGPLLIAGGAVTQGVSRMVNVFNVLGEALGVSGGEVALVTAALMALVVATLLVIKHWEPISGFFVDLWGKIKDAFVNAWENIKAFVAETWPTLIGYITGPLGTLVGKVVQNWDKIITAFVNAYNTIVEMVTKIKDAIWSKLSPVVDLMEKIGKGITDIWQKVSDKLVGHSIIPEMVDAVIEELDRMDEAMANTTGQDALVENMEKAKLQMEQMRMAIAPFTDAFGAMIVNADDGAEKFKEALKGSFAAVLEMLAKMAFAEAAYHAVPGIGFNPIASAGYTAAGIAAMVAAGAVKALGEGGIVTRPTMALVGERGPEAVIPLNKAGAMGPTIIVNVQGSVLEEEGLARRISKVVAGVGRGY